MIFQLSNSRPLSVLFFVGLLTPALVFADDFGWGDIEACPTLDLFNFSTQAWHENLENTVFFNPSYSDRRENADLPAVLDPDKVEKLRSPMHSHECQRFNEMYKHVFMEIRPDRELDRLVPSRYSMYYRYGDNFLVLTASYHRGIENENESLPPPPPSTSYLNVYDQDLNRIQSLSF
jgi:hypothetical protein